MYNTYRTMFSPFQCGIIYIQCRNDKQKDPFYRPIKIHEGRAVSLGSILSVLQFHEQKMFLSYGPVEQLQVKKTEPRSKQNICMYLHNKYIHIHNYTINGPSIYGVSCIKYHAVF